MRETFGKMLVELGEKDSSVMLLVGDIGYFYFDEFRARFPKRFINVGVCEQTMIGVAAGLALVGLKPYVYTITPFLIERPLEQVKLDIDQQNLNVKLVGYWDYPDQGPTHNSLDLQKISELFTNITSYFPKSKKDTRQVLLESYRSKRPTFISLVRTNE